MLRLVVSFLLAVSLAACVASTSGMEGAQPPERIAMSLTSWGRPVGNWSVEANGRGTYTERVSANYAPYGPYRLDHHEFDVGPEGFARLWGEVAALPNPAPTYQQCNNLRTDGVYGKLEIAQRAETRTISIYDGCFDPDYRAFYGRVAAIDELVKQWGMAQPVARSESFNTEP